VGMPVRICHLTSPDCNRYNNLIGDIYEVQTVNNQDGTQELLFDVRCPVLPDVIQSKTLLREADHYKVPVSPAAQAAAPKNRAQVAPMYGVFATHSEADDDSLLPPFVLLARLPSEKLEPLNAAAAATLAAARAGGGEARLPGHASRPPPLVLQPKWGPPLDTVIDEELPPRQFLPADEEAFLALGGCLDPLVSAAAPSASTSMGAAASSSSPAPARAASASVAPGGGGPADVLGLPGPTWDPPSPPMSAVALAQSAQLARQPPAVVVTTQSMQAQSAQFAQQQPAAAFTTQSLQAPPPQSGRFTSMCAVGAGGGGDVARGVSMALPPESGRYTSKCAVGAGGGGDVGRGVSMASSFYAGPTNFTKGGSFYAEGPRSKPFAP